MRAAPGVFDVAPASVDPLRALHAAVLSSGGFASHASAAHLLGLVDEPPACPEILVENRTDPRAGIVVHRTRHLPREDRTKVGTIACTSALRTLHDLAPEVHAEVLEDAVARAFTRRLSSARRLHRYLDRSYAGRPGTHALRAAAERYVDRTQETQSFLEVIVDRAVRSRRIPTPVRQLRVRFPGRYFDLDLAWPDERVFVEADGYGSHASPRQFAHDRARQNLLVLHGWLPLRYTWRVARHQPELVEAQVVAALEARRIP